MVYSDVAWHDLTLTCDVDIFLTKQTLIAFYVLCNVMNDYSSFKAAVCKSISKDFSLLMDLNLAANYLIWIFLTKDAKW